MAMVRLFREGGNERDSAIGDLDLAEVPEAGDHIIVEHGQGEDDVAYQVVRRHFHCRAGEVTNAKRQRIALEVREVHPAQASVLSMYRSGGGA